MKIIITVIGHDRVGIVAKVSAVLADNDVNILDINQNIVHGLFNMILVAEPQSSAFSLKDLNEKLGILGKTIGLEIRVQHEDIFNVMHRI